nr:replication protein A 70 kDa DNA-binding subunit B [Tanacetum cinerariifolium]
IAENSGRLPLLPYRFKMSFYKCTTITRIEPFDNNTNGFILEPFNHLLDYEHHQYYENDDVDVIGSVVGIGDIVLVMSPAGKRIRRTMILKDVEVEERDGYEANQVKIELFTSEVKVVSIAEFFHGAINRMVGCIRDSEPDSHCIVYARIHRIHKEYGWAYTACKNCNKKVDILPRQNQPPVYLCEEHGTIQPASSVEGSSSKKRKLIIDLDEVERIRIVSGAIDVFTHVLNYAEKFHDRKSLRRVFCNTSMVSEKMLCEDWDAKYKSDLFIQNMSNVLRATLYQKLKMVDLDAPVTIKHHRIEKNGAIVKKNYVQKNNNESTFRFNTVKKISPCLHLKTPTKNLTDEPIDEEFWKSVDLNEDFVNLFDEEANEDVETKPKTHTESTNNFGSLDDLADETAEDFYDLDMFSMRFVSNGDVEDSFINDDLTDYYDTDKDI